MKKNVTHRLALASFVILTGILSLSSSGGKSDAYAGHPEDQMRGAFCSDCHSGGNGGAGVTLTGVPANYTAGATYPLTLTVTDASPTATAKAGFQIVAAADASNNIQIGTFSTPSGTALNDLDRLVQSTPQTMVVVTGMTKAASWTFNWTAPSSGAPAEVTFYFSGNAVDGNGSTGGDNAVIGTSASVPLPVQFTKIEAERTEKDVEVTWSTASEIGAKQFQIHRSIDNIRFEAVGQVAAAGESQTEQRYQFTDSKAPTTRTVYYRIEQVDFDGTTNISQSVAVRFDAPIAVQFRHGNLLSWHDEAIHFTVTSKLPVHTARIFDQTGRAIAEQRISEDQEITMPITGTGHLFLQLLDAQGIVLKTERIIRI